MTTRRFTYWFLFAIFIVAIVIGAIRPLRVSPLYQIIGVIQFAAMALAAWILGARAIMTGSRKSRLLAIAGIFLITPFALLALLWVGLGPPWEATPPENQMRYLVLAAMTIAIVVGFVVLRQALGDADKNSVGFAAILLAGPLYLILNAFGFGVATARLHGGEIPPAFRDLNEIVPRCVASLKRPVVIPSIIPRSARLEQRFRNCLTSFCAVFRGVAQCVFQRGA